MAGPGLGPYPLVTRPEFQLWSWPLYIVTVLSAFVIGAVVGYGIRVLFSRSNGHKREVAGAIFSTGERSRDGDAASDLTFTFDKGNEPQSSPIADQKPMSWRRVTLIALAILFAWLAFGVVFYQG